MRSLLGTRLRLVRDDRGENMNLQKAQNIYLVGIKGVGMTALAIILKKMGKTISGSDSTEIFITDSVLADNGIKYNAGFDATHIIDGIDLIITTGAHEGLQNIEVLTGKKMGISVMTHAEALGRVMDQFTTKIAVCGTHGKTTTSAMISFVFQKLGLKFGYHVGTPIFSGLPGGGFTGYDYFVTEADEYVASPGIDNTPRFMYLNPDIVICTGIEYDHPDVYKTPESMEQAYRNFFKKLDNRKGTLIYCSDDQKLTAIVKQFTNLTTIPYSLSTPNDTILLVAGNHNKQNAAAVLTVCEYLKFDIIEVKKALSNFTGSARRLEKKYEANGTLLYDDYAHHPTEIKATIQALKEMYPNKRIILLFQPHTYSRTEALQHEFITALSSANTTLLTDIFASAREKNSDFTITSQKLVEEAQNKGIKTIEYCAFDHITQTLASIAARGDIVVTMGAGSIYKLHSGIIEVLNKL